MKFTAWFRRGGWSLAAGTLLLVLLLVTSTWSATSEGESERSTFRFEPPHSSLMRAILWSPSAADSLCTTVLLSGQGCATDTLNTLQSTPTPVARVGRLYRSRVRSSRALTGWSMHGQPPELSIDSTTGVISGVPAVADTFVVTITAQINGDSAIQQSFKLFVDDRNLVLGANRSGKDVFRMLVRSTRYMLLPGTIVAAIAVVVGTVVGALAGFYKGPMRLVLQTFVAILQSVPGFILIVAAAAASGLNHWVVMLVVGFILVPDIALGVVECVESLVRKDFVQAARELGLRDRDILWREIIWHNARIFLANRAVNAFLFGIMMEITLSYLRQLNPLSGSLGVMLRSGRETAHGIGGSYNEMGAVVLGIIGIVVTTSLLDRGIRRTWTRVS